jgi:O-antigen/teichoic acid export membrane protein
VTDIKKNTSSTELIKSIVRNLGVKGLAIPMSFASGVLLARYMGSESYGVYGLLLSIATVICSGIIRFNSILLVREISAAITKKEDKYILGSVLVSMLVVVITIIAVMVGVEVLALLGIVTSEYLIPVIILMLVLTCVGSILRGFDKTAVGLFTEQAVRPTTQTVLLLILAGGSVVGVNISLEQGVNSLLLAILIAVMFGLLNIFRVFSRQIVSKGVGVKREWLTQTLPSLTVLGWSQGLNTQLPTLLIGWLLLASDVGTYKVADAMSGLISLTLIAANVALGPKIAAASANKNKELFEHLLRTATTMVVLIAVPLAVFFILVANVVIPFVFGQEYAQATTFFWILCVSQLVNSFCGPVMMALNMLKREKDNVKAVFVSLIITMSLGLFLIPSYGLIGAALAQLIGVCVWNFYLVWILFSRENILCIPYLWKKNEA